MLSKTKPIVRFSCHVAATIVLLISGKVQAQSIRFPWNGYGHDPQHDAISPVASQPLNRILWQTPVDLNPQYSGGELFIHYGSPLITRSNTVIVPVKTGAAGGFEVKALAGATGVMSPRIIFCRLTIGFPVFHPR